MADERGLLVLNTLPWARNLVVDEPDQRGGAAPVGVLDMFFPPGVPWGGNKPQAERLSFAGDVPAWGYAYLREPCVTGPEMAAGAGWVENGAYRIEVDPARGGLARWVDKATGQDLISPHRGWVLGQYVYERVISPEGREALFVPDFSAKDFGSWRDDVEFAYDGPTAVKVHEPRIRAGRASIAVDVAGPGVRSGTCTFTLWQGRRHLDIEWSFDKIAVEDPESVFFAFPFAAEAPSFFGDFNGIPCEPDVEQLPGSVRSWYPVQGWVGVDGTDHSIVLVPLDAPLVHLGGVNTGRIVEHLDPGSPVVMSWALNNHWFVNFKAQQDGQIRLRYSLTSMSGHLDVDDAMHFAAEARTPLVVLRDREAIAAGDASVLKVLEGADIVVGSKVSEDGAGIVVRLLNFKRDAQRVTIDLGRPVTGAWAVRPDEREREALVPDGHRLTTVVDSRCGESILLKW